MAISTIIGFPRVGEQRELKTSVESYWNGKINAAALMVQAADLRMKQWQYLNNAGLGQVPSNDFSFYDMMLDMSALLGVVPARYGFQGDRVDLDTYFAIARGRQKDGIDVPASDMTKWFDTNYHYIVPEFTDDQQFKCASQKPVDDFLQAKKLGIETRPVLIGPITYLMLGKQSGHKPNLALIDRLLPVYIDIVQKLVQAGASWVQIDEPALVLDLDDATRKIYTEAFQKLRAAVSCKIFFTTYFGSLGNNLSTALKLPIDALHIDLCHGHDSLTTILDQTPSTLTLSLGVVNGRNIWRNDLSSSLSLLETAAQKIGKDRVWVSSSCSLLHTPYDLNGETALDPELKSWMAFAKQKVQEIVTLTKGLNAGRTAIAKELAASDAAVLSRRNNPRIHQTKVAARLQQQPLATAKRNSPFPVRKRLQMQRLNLPLYPTTTIGSFPQTPEVRKYRSDFKKGAITKDAYNAFLKKEIEQSVRLQEKIGIDVLVHGEFERNDMVEYFGENLEGFAFTLNGWVQSYGSRCVKPPIIYGDVSRPHAMTTEWSGYAQSLTKKPMKGMLTGPVTILQWSFVRDDQPRSVTTHQIALALQDEVLDLEKNGIGIIQIDEPAFREGLPLRRSDWPAYLTWAAQAFRLSFTGVRDDTQIHTHMCYCEFNDIFDSIQDLDADVISIETSRSQMELLGAFSYYKYPNDIGPGVYDIHSPRIPSEAEMIALLQRAREKLDADQIWVNPDCGLKTRGWPETTESLTRMVNAARAMREQEKRKEAS